MRLLPCLFLFCSIGCEKSRPSAENETATASVDPAVAALRDTMIGSMCEDGSYERSCFDVTREGCRQLVAESYDACVRDNVAEIGPGAKAGKIGGLIGSCTSKAYIHRLRGEGKITTTGRCADPASFF